jgi:DNA invertase Pin-like site-specific DNA recombinase
MARALSDLASDRNREKREGKPPGNIFAYTRVSSARQAEDGMSLESQRDAILRYIPYKFSPLEKYGWDPDNPAIYQDSQSASKLQLDEREAGGEMVRRLQPNDHVVFVRYDRGFRNFPEFANWITRWKSQDITIHDITTNIDTSTDMGRAVACILAVMGQVESDRLSERLLEGFDFRRSQVLPVGWNPPIGYKIVGTKKARAFAVDTVQRAFLDKVAGWHQYGMTFEAIHYRLRRQFLDGDRRGPHVTVTTKGKVIGPVNPAWLAKAIKARSHRYNRESTEGYPLTGHEGRNLAEALVWAQEQESIPRP